MANPVIRKHSNIGAADAESDQTYLDECFVDTGDLQILLDCQDPKCIVLGRTGSGKTALLKQVLDREDTKELPPETLALSYIANSNTLKFFEEIGVKLDVFYQLLWRHILTVELIKLKYHIKDKDSQDAFINRIVRLFTKNSTKQRALNYLQEWRNKFWEETEYRTKEFTQKLESDLKIAANVDAKYLQLGSEGASKLTEEERIEVKNRATKVVNEVQVKELHDVIELLAQDLFNDKNKFYIVIDRLDENWVDDYLRFKLIRALIETVKTFKRVTCVKIIVGLRTDLQYHLFKMASDSGFQEEKYKSLYLPLKWNREDLTNLLDNRVNFMFKRQYTKSGVKLLDILPKNQIAKRTPLEYILDRTFFRPREAIIYLNACIAEAVGSAEISINIIRSVEVSYSLERLESLSVEWAREYPLLKQYLILLRAKGNISLRLEEFSKSEIDNFVIEMLSNESSTDPIYARCKAYYETSQDAYSLLEDVFLALYQVGLIGVKTEPNLGRQWSYFDLPILAKGQIKKDSLLDIHKTFWAALGLSQHTKKASAH